MEPIWMMAALDALAIVMLGALLWRLRRDPEAAWDARERRLVDVFERLRVLVAQSEGVARDLDAALGAHQQRLHALLADATAAAHAAAPAPPDAGVSVARARRLAASGTPIDEIARR